MMIYFRLLKCLHALGDYRKPFNDSGNVNILISSLHF